ncbi:hypothetical protein H5410_012405, partial [Solanum commersonii]
VSILNGIVMGGGLGVSVHGRFRVATKKTVCAMPEAALGVFRDVGTSYFYSRLPGFFGEYAGLTGARFDGAEMFACGLATHFVPSERLPFLEQELVKVNTSDPDVISAIITHFSNIPKLKAESPYNKMTGSLQPSIQSMKKASPISLKITLRSIREGRLQDVGSCLIREYRMVCHVFRGEFSNDFFETEIPRCVMIHLIMNNPEFRYQKLVSFFFHMFSVEPSKLELIRDDDVDRYFSKIDDEDWEDLKLPPRSNLLPYAIAKI